MPARVHPSVLQNPTLNSLLAAIQHGDTNARVSAVKQSVLVGTSAIVPLGQIAGGDDPAAARAATEALSRIAYHAGRPKAGKERKDAVARLTELAQASYPRALRAQAVFLMGAIAGSEGVKPLALLLEDRDLAEDARMALTRIPGREAEAALRAALQKAPENRKGAFEQSLKHRAISMREIGAKR